MFWIIEAKEPSVKIPFEYKYIVQGLQYCIHPEIQANYLVLTNGLYTAIYNAQDSFFMGDNIYEPFFSFHSFEVESRWKSIYCILSAEGMRALLEKRLKFFYEKLASTSLNINYPDILLEKIQQDKFSVIHDIEKKNISSYNSRFNQSIINKNQEKLDCSDDILELYMDHPARGWGLKAYEILFNRFKKNKNDDYIYDYCTINYERFSFFRKENTFTMLADLYNNTKYEILQEKIKKFMLDNMFSKMSILNKLETLILRIHRKIIILNAYDNIKEEIFNHYETTPEFIKFGRYPRVLDFTYPHELILHDDFFAKIKDAPDELLLIGYNLIFEMEQKINNSYELKRSLLSNDDFEILGDLSRIGLYDFIPSLKIICANKGIFPYEYLDELQKKIRPDLYG